MFDIKKYIFTVCCAMAISTGWGADLSGSAAVNITSTTAATAKNIAMDEARRQIILDVLGQYAERPLVAAAIKSADAADLNALIAATGIDGERLSDTTYSANITMTIDAAAARNWMAVNNIQNWLNNGAGGDKILVVVTLSDKMADWMDLNRIARAQNIDLGTRSIMDRNVTVELPASHRAAFASALRDAGWKYTDADGVLRIWK